MQRDQFRHDGLRLSYLDAGGDGRVLVALHAHWMEGATYAPLAEALAPEWRVLALDQRGHGHSDHAPSYSRNAYLGDIKAFFAHLGLSSAVVLGNSLGGVNAYQLAARHPGLVQAMIIEDIGAVVANDASFVLDWRGTFPTRDALAARVGPRFTPYLADSFRETPEGWRLAFDPEDMVASQDALNGDHFDDWLASSCPVLLLRGSNSRVTSPEHLQEMAARRRNTSLEALDGGHVIHVDAPAAFVECVRRFLRTW
jgi:esterase